RGSLAAMRSAAQLFLVGNRTVNIYERINSAYHMVVQTYFNETPDPNIVRAALMSQKPAGIVLDYTVTIGQTWLQLRSNHPDWADVDTEYDTWLEVLNDQP